MCAHHKVTGLRLAALAAAHGLAARLHLQALHLAVPVLHRDPGLWPVMCQRDIIHKTGTAYRIATPSDEDGAGGPQDFG